MWAGDDTILAAIIPEDLGPAPEKPMKPEGPLVQDFPGGGGVQTNTHRDLLQVHAGPCFRG